jgi:uncharacterized protein (DUF3820 family)
MKELTEQDKMPTGVHQGKQMQDVPAEYLINYTRRSDCPDNVKEYVADRINLLQAEVIKDRAGQRKDSFIKY